MEPNRDSAGSPQIAPSPKIPGDEGAGNALQLPLSVVSQIDVARVAREIEAVGDFLTQASLRTPGTPMQLPRTSRMLDEFLNVNSLNLLQPADFTQAKQFIADVKQTAPVLRMSFAVEPSVQVIEKVIAWLRREISPLVLLQTGLQPDIGAGFILRTPNRYIDCSLRQNFAQTRTQLIQAIRGDVA